MVTVVPSSTSPRAITLNATGSVLFERQWVGSAEQIKFGLPVLMSSPGCSLRISFRKRSVGNTMSPAASSPFWSFEVDRCCWPPPPPLLWPAAVLLARSFTLVPLLVLVPLLWWLLAVEFDDETLFELVLLLVVGEVGEVRTFRWLLAAELRWWLTVAWWFTAWWTWFSWWCSGLWRLWSTSAMWAAGGAAVNAECPNISDWLSGLSFWLFFAGLPVPRL